MADPSEFWAAIDEARAAAGNDRQRVAALSDLLAWRGAEAIKEFAEVQAQLMAESYSWPLWGAAYVINGGCSDDGFDYFRGWLLLQGRAVWESALRDPETLLAAEPPAGDTECEDMLYAAANAYERVTGRSDLGVAAATPPEPSGPGWEEDDLPERFPRLWERYGAAAAPVAVDEDLEVRTQGHMELGMLLLGRRRYDPALDAFTRASELAPRPLTAALAINNMAWTRLLRNGADDVAAALPLAEEAARRMRELGAPDFAEYAAGTLALALICNGRDEEGVAMVEPLLELKQPASIRAVRKCVLAIGAAHLGRRGQALRLILEVAVTQPRCELLGRAWAALAPPRNAGRNVGRG